MRCPGGGWAPGCASAWPSPRSGTRSGTCSASPALVIAWDVGARRAAGLRVDLGGTLRRARWLPAWCGLLPLAVYVITWSGWFFTSSGYDRQWAAQNGIHVPVISALASFVQYQKQILQFHLGLTTHHPYQSQPWTWLVMSRPVAFFWQCPAGGTHGSCGAVGTKAQEVLAIGTPLIWWASIAALLVCLLWWLTRRDWRAGAVLLAVAVGWLPWFWFAVHDHRTEFFFYALEFEPFLIIVDHAVPGADHRPGAGVRHPPHGRRRRWSAPTCSACC